MKANEARCTRKIVARGTRELVAVMLITELIQGTPHSAVKKEDSNRREIVKKTGSAFRESPEP